jgi:TonB family protein
MLRRLEGSVQLRAVVQTDGTVGEVTVAKSLDPGLDEEAVKAARQFRFSPATKNGTPVAMTVNIVLDFNIRKKEPSAQNGWPTGFAVRERVPLPETTLTAGQNTIKVGLLEGWSTLPIVPVGPLLTARHTLGAVLTIESALYPASPSARLTLEDVSAVVDQAAKGVPTKQSGVVEIQGRKWAWAELATSNQPPPPEVFDDAANRRGVREWLFMSPLRDRLLSVSCRVYIPKDATAAAGEEAIQRVSQDCATIINSLGITAP